MYLASLEVDQRQTFIHQADTLKELIGGSHLISATVGIAENLCKVHKAVRLIWPVSGVLRFESDALEELAKFLWELRDELDGLGLPSTIGIVPRTKDIDHDFNKIEEAVRRAKDAKAGSVAVPSLPYFARCRVLPDQPANESAESPKNERRELTSWRAEIRNTYLLKFARTLYEDLNCGIEEIPHDLDDLVASETDSYIAIVKGDVDGLGRLLASLKFEALAKVLGITASEAAQRFSKALGDCLQNALIDSMNAHAPEGKRKRFPIIRLFDAGDDVLFICQRHLALPIVSQFATHYERAAANEPTLNKALELVGLLGKERLTISFGIVFAKKGFPFSVSADMAETLTRSAKKRRAKLPDDKKEGTVDFHWLASSAREDISQSRRQHEAYRDENADAEMQLYTRPWVASQLHAALSIPNHLANFPSRKLHQLAEILRLGKTLSEAAYKAWRARLTKTEQEHFDAAILKISHNRKVPWNRTSDGFDTPLLELQMIHEIHSRTGGNNE